MQNGALLSGVGAYGEVLPVVSGASRWLSRRFLIGVGLGLLLVGYWSFGKSFGYIGLYPVFIGEVLLLSLLTLCLSYGCIFIAQSASFWVCVSMLAVGTVQVAISVLGFGQPALEALRNFAVFYYALFAYISYVYCARNSIGTSWKKVDDWLSRRAFLILCGLTISYTLQSYWAPTPASAIYFPGTEMPVLSYKPTDASMPLLMILCFWIRNKVKDWCGIWAFGFILLAAAQSRSVLLAFSFFLVMMWRPTKRGIGFLALCLTAFAVLWVADVNISISNKSNRTLSVRQFAKNIISIVEEDKSDQGESTKDWRLRWWRSILADAVENDRVLTGSGWGANPADMYGFYTSSTGIHALRNPHNVFLSILVRGGWLATLLYALVHIVLFAELFWARQKFRYLPEQRYLCLLVMAFLTVSLLHGSTDVFLESPQNAAPHWIVVGLAWGLITAASRLPLQRGPIHCLDPITPRNESEVLLQYSRSSDWS